MFVFLGVFISAKCLTACYFYYFKILIYSSKLRY